MTFACIHVPNFPLAAVLRAEAELRSQPVAVLEGKPPLEKVLAVNERANAIGIEPGMTKTQAELCRELVLRPRSPMQESTAHAALLDGAQSFSPCVEDSACDTVLLDLAGMESLLGTLPGLARALHQRAASLGLEANIAIASNPDTAMLAARGFPGVTVIPFGKEVEWLGPLPLKVLFAEQPGSNGDQPQRKQRDQAERLLETFERWGVRNLRALAGLPEIALSERLGQNGVHLRQLARGAASRTLVPVEEPIVFEEGLELENPILLLEPLAFLLNQLLEKICARLASRALATQELQLTLDLDNQPGIDEENENFGIPSESDDSEVPQLKQPRYFVAHRKSTFTRTLRLPLPMLDARLFLKLLQLDLNAHPPGAPIVKIHLHAEPVRPRSMQSGLFLPPSPEPEKLELILARIGSLVGETQVGAVELLDTHRPEGFRMQRFTTQSAGTNQKSADQDSSGREPAVMALRRFRPALRAAVTLESGLPAQVVCASKKEVQGKVLWKAGPWRSSGDWWEREAWARDEWDIALQQAECVALYRLVHDLLGGGWFLEGTYD